ncbi:amidohydrolase family protein [Alteromonas sp. LMIT006]|uniref:amidohydrolase family protein n=1 Tax=Alteromonadaceae TaxID=72275 RepID=UPI0020CA7411|nr:amidohydrolase family protein [Alteromonas sp. LMIT006]UTP71743.1 amidohydrolase family protein [Alteromonas sp. LMIT006]
MNFIDPHIHLWDTDQGDYHWLHNTNNLPLHVNDSAITCEAYVHVEAGFDNNQPWRELTWLESVATKPMRAVATLDLTLSTASFVESLRHYAKHPFCVGGRHILDNDALDLLHNAQILDNLDTLAQHGYLFEAQFDVADQAVVARVCELLLANPDWQWVINHAGYPVLSAVDQEQWRVGIHWLSKIPSLMVKCSGFEMQERDFAWEDALRVIDHCITSFGENRVMLASNYPLLTWRMSYNEYWAYLTQAYADRPELFYDNAQRTYFANT